MNVARLALRLMGKPLAHQARFSKSILSRSNISAARVPDSFSSKYIIKEESIDGRRIITATLMTGASDWNIIYTHGGAYVNELSKAHWNLVEALIDATGATVTIPLYPLAPEFSHHDAFNFLTMVYRRILLTTPVKNIVMAGDSAGAGLALGQAIEFRSLGLPLPSHIIAFSPWLDLTLADSSAASIESEDIMLGIASLRQCGLWWALDDDPKSPRLSPLYADLRGLPPIDIYQGSLDLLVVDARSFYAKVKEVGGVVRYFEYPAAFHVFMAATFTPESKDVFRRISVLLPPNSHFLAASNATSAS